MKHAGGSKSPQPPRESSSSHNRAEDAPIGDRRQCSYRAGLDQSDRDFAVASFLKSLSSLFGGKRESDGEPAPKGDGEEYNGFTVRPAPYKEGGQYQTCGYVEKEIGGELKSHKFIRADRFASLDDAVQFSLTKGKQLIDEQGEGLFR
ncbi:HlyU family transcriptional regulator [Labrys sp. LIt4]|uniref:HlyU family transcriptional regulator n=1 Tax=Labrys sp. LIt4 TaxID=2821355 RepID=UPI0032AFEBBE